MKNPAIQSNFALRYMVFLAWTPGLFVAGALGPYLGGTGLKTEHVLIYGVGLAYSVTFLPVHRLNLWRSLPISMPLWACLGLTQAVGYFATSTAARDITTMSRILAAVEHLAQPLVVVTVMWSLGRILPPESLTKALDKALNILVWGLCLNSLLVGWLIATGEIGPFAAWLPPTAGDPGTVWATAMQGGRYGGIFNQPFESGLSYSLAALAWYRLQSQRKRTPFWEYARLLLLVFGGLVSVSKVFLFAALPLFIAFVLVRKVNRALIAGLLVLVTAVFVFYRVQDSWNGSSLMTGYFSLEKGGDALNLYTGNRFAHDRTQVEEQFSEVWDSAPIFGFGFAPFEIIDSGFLWAFGSGGIIGAGIFALLLSKALIRTWGLVRKNREQVFSFLILLLMVAASVGAPAFTINRGSTIFWTLFPLAVLMGLRQAAVQSHARSATVHASVARRVSLRTRPQEANRLRPNREPLIRPI